MSTFQKYENHIIWSTIFAYKHFSLKHKLFVFKYIGQESGFELPPKNNLLYQPGGGTLEVAGQALHELSGGGF